MIFQLSFASKIVQIESLYAQVCYMCRDYLVDPMMENVDISISMTEADIEQERTQAKKEPGSSSYSDRYLETLAVYRKIATEMLYFDSWLMHGAVLSVNDRAYMVTAPSRSGKTTVIRLALKLFEDSFVVNGDKPLLQIKDDQILACGTPWAGKERMNRNCQVPLKAIFILERGDENKFEELSFSQAFPVILQQTYKPEEINGIKKTLSLLSKLGSKEFGVKFYRLSIKRYDSLNEIENDEVCSLITKAFSDSSSV